MPGQTNIAVRFEVDRIDHDQKLRQAQQQVREIVTKIKLHEWRSSNEYAVDVWQNEGGQ